MKYNGRVDPQTLLHQNIARLVGCRKGAVAGEIGIEIECEGRNLWKDDYPLWWLYHNDPSLRGDENAEYVLNAPIERKRIGEVLKYLADRFEAGGSVIVPSYRTSSHVHLNFGKATVRDVYTFACLYFILEDVLFDIAGRERAGNVHCLRALDAEYLIDTLRESLRSTAFANLGGDNMRYAALNFKALRDHGSLEIRSFRGVKDPMEIEEWVNVLCDIKDVAQRFENPQQICMDFSVKGALGFLRDNFKPKTVEVFLRSKNLEGRMFEGVRLAQDIAWAIPSWDYIKKPEEAANKPDADNPWAEPVNWVNAALHIEPAVAPVRGRRAVPPQPQFWGIGADVARVGEAPMHNLIDEDDDINFDIMDDEDED